MNRSLVGILIALALSLSIGVSEHVCTDLSAGNCFLRVHRGTKRDARRTYTISSISQSVILIRNRNTAKSVLMVFCPEHGGSSDGPPKLGLHKYGNKYFLWRVSYGFDSAVMQLPTSKLEKEMQIASSGGVSEQKTVVAAK
jgi:hypothetical protein